MAEEAGKSAGGARADPLRRTLDALEARLVDMERKVLGGSGAGHGVVQGNAASGAQVPRVNVLQRLRALEAGIPLSLELQQLLSQCKALGLDDRGMAQQQAVSPLDSKVKREILLGSASWMHWVAQQADAINELKRYAGGKNWGTARNEEQRLGNIEKRVAERIMETDQISGSFDQLLGEYDNFMTILIEKLARLDRFAAGGKDTKH